jgi:transcriptional regulator with XRE-family HTH domain
MMQGALERSTLFAMTGRQLRRGLKQLGISQMELARRLHVAPSTVRRWIADRTPIPHAVALLLKEWMAKV